MLVVVQILTALFVIFSLGLIITVPVALATPGQWETSKNNIFKSATIWSVFVLVIGLANSFIK